MYEYFVKCCYEGTAYAGSQYQLNTPRTIESVVSEALSRIFRQKLKLTFSSRTDAGVHSLANVLSFTLEERIIDLERVLYSANSLLPMDIALYDLRELKAKAHPRFSAISRRYSYNLHTCKMPFYRHHSCFYPYPLRPQLLEAMAKTCIGTRDFSSFAKKHSEVQNHICNLVKASWNFYQDKITLELEANRFLRGMVRALVGTMLYIDRKGGSLEDFQQLLQKPVVASAPSWASAIGLTLMEVSYPDGLW